MAEARSVERSKQASRGITPFVSDHYFSYISFSNACFLRCVAVAFDKDTPQGSKEGDKPYHLWLSCWGIIHISHPVSYTHLTLPTNREV